MLQRIQKRKNSIFLVFLFLIGNIFHIWGFSLNEILKVADSFAYLQMSYFLKHFSVEGLGSGWFGFVYSLPIAGIDIFLGNDFLSAKIVNLLLFNISAYLLYKIARNFFSVSWSLLPVALLFFSPTLLHFNIHILSENIYIPLFLLLIYKLGEYYKHPSLSQTFFISGILGCMYLTRAEAFIYMASIGLIALSLVYYKKLSLSRFFCYGAVFILSFFVFISPYLFHLHTLTGEWGLTNKGASNLRQAQLRGIETMDDSGFEKAVAELTPDKHHLIAGFAGGMKYDTPQIEENLLSYIQENPKDFQYRIKENYKKLFTKNIPEIFLGKAPELYFSDDMRFKGNILFLVFSLFPLLVLVYGSVKLYFHHKHMFIIFGNFFVIALLFFTIFFTLNRYFLIFLPLMFLVFTYGLREISLKHKFISTLCILQIAAIYLLSNSIYINTEKYKDKYYNLKQQAGIWLLENNISHTQTNILERFPIVTYYSGTKNRWITPYTDNIEDIQEYAAYNDIDFLVVDTMDFLTYRPELKKYLEITPPNMTLLKEFSNEENQKVILYQFKK